MKRILALLLFLCVQTTFAQEKIENLTIKTTDTTLRYDPHSLGISFRMGGVVGSSESYGVYSTVFEFYTQGRKGRTKYTPMVGIRLSSPLSGANDYTFGGFRWGFLFGGSQYVFDLRSEETGKGWSMLVNGGVTADIPGIKEFIEITSYPITFGAEMEFKAIYNVHKYVGISFGLHMGYAFGFDARQIANDALNGNDMDFSDICGLLNQIDVDHNFTVGFNFGVIF